MACVGLAALFVTGVPASVHAQGTTVLPALPLIQIDSTRLLNANDIVGTSTSVISAEEIARSPALTVQEIIAQVPGVQIRTLFGADGGAGTAVDLRGFGAFGTANTLILINGRRLNDIDQAGVDLTTIPRDSIERIEITRGNSAAVLYGDNAVGGAINIITKTGVGKPLTARADIGMGSFKRYEGSASVTTSTGPFSAAIFANGLRSDGYRVNNHFDQRNMVADFRYAVPGLMVFGNFSVDDQSLGLPGARLVDPSAGINLLQTDRRGPQTPRDYGNKQGVNLTAGFSKTLWAGAELIVDGGLRQKNQQAGYFTPFAESYVDASLTTLSFTPRVNIQHSVFSMPSRILAGIDIYNASYNSARSQFSTTSPIHIYDLDQQTIAAYWQQTVSILPTTDISFGGRIQQTNLNARDTFDPFAPGAFDTQSFPLDQRETNHALHVGFEHRFNDVVSVFARAGRSFRVPNVDERLVTGPAFDPITFMPIPQTFKLRTQTSHDVEAGARFRLGALDIQSSVYDMRLKDEIHFDPANFLNYNLDPTHRYGSETTATLRVNPALMLRGGFALTRAVFSEGPFTGNDVPLVSRFTASGGVTWNIWQNYLVLDATVRYWSSRRMDNDQANAQTVIPANATADLKFSGEYQNLFWSASVNNLFDTKYYDYAVASAFTAGRFNAYPLPGRTFLVKLGAKY